MSLRIWCPALQLLKVENLIISKSGFKIVGCRRWQKSHTSRLQANRASIKATILLLMEEQKQHQSINGNLDFEFVGKCHIEPWFVEKLQMLKVENLDIATSRCKNVGSRRLWKKHKSRGYSPPFTTRLVRYSQYKKERKTPGTYDDFRSRTVCWVLSDWFRFWKFKTKERKKESPRHWLGFQQKRKKERKKEGDSGQSLGSQGQTLTLFVRLLFVTSLSLVNFLVNVTVTDAEVIGPCHPSNFYKFKGSSPGLALFCFVDMNCSCTPQYKWMHVNGWAEMSAVAAPAPTELVVSNPVDYFWVILTAKMYGVFTLYL